MRWLLSPMESDICSFTFFFAFSQAVLSLFISSICNMKNDELVSILPETYMSAIELTSQMMLGFSALPFLISDMRNFLSGVSPAKALVMSPLAMMVYFMLNKHKFSVLYMSGLITCVGTLSFFSMVCVLAQEEEVKLSRLIFLLWIFFYVAYTVLYVVLPLTYFGLLPDFNNWEPLMECVYMDLDYMCIMYM